MLNLCQFFYHASHIECRRIERASLDLLFCIGYLILWGDQENGILNGIFGHAELKSVKVTCSENHTVQSFIIYIPHQILSG